MVNTISAVKVKELPVEAVLETNSPYIVDLTFSKYDFQKGGEQITDYSISETNKRNIKLLYISI